MIQLTEQHLTSMNSATQASAFDDNKSNTSSSNQLTSHTLKENVEQALTTYFEKLDGQHTTELYDLFMHQVEAPLFACVMQHTQDNQSKAATILGLNRGTLRKKLKQYDLL